MDGIIPAFSAIVGVNFLTGFFFKNPSNQIGEAVRLVRIFAFCSRATKKKNIYVRIVVNFARANEAILVSTKVEFLTCVVGRNSEGILIWFIFAQRHIPFAVASDLICRFVKQAVIFFAGRILKNFESRNKKKCCDENNVDAEQNKFWIFFEEILRH